MRLADGREVLCTLALPLPLDLAGELISAVGRAAGRAGYTDVVWQADTGRIVGRRRERRIEHGGG